MSYGNLGIWRAWFCRRLFGDAGFGLGCLAAGYLDGALEALAFHLVVAGADNGLGVAVGVGDTEGLVLGQFDGFLAFVAVEC